MLKPVAGLLFCSVLLSAVTLPSRAEIEPAASLNASPEALRIFRQAQTSRHFELLHKLSYQLRPTSDGKSFVVQWRSCASPKKWIVSLHGSRGFATDDMALWSRHLPGREVGLICLQWWKAPGRGGDQTSDYLQPQEIYREADLALQDNHVQPGQVMFHGFSRGAANCYAVTGIDRIFGKSYFAVTVANSGGYNQGYPPNRFLENDDLGQPPLRGTRWITVAGGRDPNPERDGVPAMRRTCTWLESHGAEVIDRVEAPALGHGALPQSLEITKQVLDRFCPAEH